MDLVFFSGDKLLGGPQAGIIVGRGELIGMLERHPLARATRIDKLSLAALSATLLHYLKGEAQQKVPIWRMITSRPDELKQRAERWREEIGDRAAVTPGLSTIGGGSLPGETLPTWTVALRCDDVAGGVEGVAARLRQAMLPVVGYIEEDRVILDPQTVSCEEEVALLQAVDAALKGNK